MEARRIDRRSFLHATAVAGGGIAFSLYLNPLLLAQGNEDRTLITDLLIRQLPTTYPNVGGLTGKNTIITDPVFGATVVRLTDGTSGSGNFSSMSQADEGYTSCWNTDDTLLFVSNSGAEKFIHQFDPTTMQGTQLGTKSPYSFAGAGAFSKVQNNKLFVFEGTTISANTFALVAGVWVYQSTELVCDFANILPSGFKVKWSSGLHVANDDSTFTVGVSQGAQQTGYFVCLYKVDAGYRLLDTRTGQVTGQWGAVGQATIQSGYKLSFPFYLHAVDQFPNPDYSGISAVTPVIEKPNVGHEVVWANGGLTLVDAGPGPGHCGKGYLGLYWDNGFVAYDNASQHTTIIPPNLEPQNQTPPQVLKGDQHYSMSPSDDDEELCWITNGPPVFYPFTSCWMGELRGLDVTGKISGVKGTMYRACHTYNSGKSPSFSTQQSIACVSQTKNFVAFCSDWGGSGTVGPLGSTKGAATGVIGGDARGDVFIAAVGS